MCHCSLKFPVMFFPLEEYRRDMSLDEWSMVSVELLVPLIVLKISWGQVLIQNKDRETHKDFSNKKTSQNFLSSCTVVLRNKHLSDLFCRKKYFSREGVSSNASLPF